ncbi:hypothetical protein O3P69_011415 [Scylla paramamosain]|uniref:Uncharacterized protein n=1 Tax=Scylla paramamosain TaxID=85552 RepID=A0AAW0T5L8_SCYPA
MDLHTVLPRPLLVSPRLPFTSPSVSLPSSSVTSNPRRDSERELGEYRDADLGSGSLSGSGFGTAGGGAGGVAGAGLGAGQGAAAAAAALAVQLESLEE